MTFGVLGAVESCQRACVLWVFIIPLVGGETELNVAVIPLPVLPKGLWVTSGLAFSCGGWVLGPAWAQVCERPATLGESKTPGHSEPARWGSHPCCGSAGLTLQDLTASEVAGSGQA